MVTPSSKNLRDLRDDISHEQLQLKNQSEALATIKDANKTTSFVIESLTRRHERKFVRSNDPKKFLWKERQQDHHFHKRQQITIGRSSAGLNKTITDQPKILARSTVLSSSNINNSKLLQRQSSSIIVESKNSAIRQSTPVTRNQRDNPQQLTTNLQTQRYETIRAASSSSAEISSKGSPFQKISNVVIHSSITSPRLLKPQLPYIEKSKLSLSRPKVTKNLSQQSTNNFPTQRKKKLLQTEKLMAVSSSSTKTSLDGSPLQKPKKSPKTISGKVKCEKKIASSSAVQPRSNVVHKKISTKLVKIPLRSNNQPDYYKLFMRKHVKIHHNPRKRVRHRPEISYVFKDKMCWHKTRRFKQPRRLLKYRATAKLNDEDEYFSSPITSGDLKCYIFGLARRIPKFHELFTKLCKIIGAEDFPIVNVRRQNGATVIQLRNSNERSKLFAAFERYEEMVKKGNMLPLTSKLCGGNSENKVYIQSGSNYIYERKLKKSNFVSTSTPISLNAEILTTMLYSRRYLPIDACRHGYGTLVNSSKAVLYAF